MKSGWPRQQTFRSCGRSLKGHAVWVPDPGYPPPPVTEDHTSRIARDEVILGCEQGKVVGLIVVEPGDGHDRIFSVAVDPDHAGNGIRPRLIANPYRGKGPMCWQYGSEPIGPIQRT
ncbi:GNAT family N-acetyltransferase [Paraburkholderia ribeironis]|uniref:GNAT family N-acetyltransferase n=1 Tax=Paraburkholderia ribeironis TaxID=1247936 RepID=UPI003CCBA598